jgi:hypothetical protein
MGDCDLPTAGNMIDTNLDWNLTAADALGVINYINSRSHRSVMSSPTASGGQGEPMSSSGDVSSGSDAAASQATMPEPSTTTTTSTPVNTAAADDLYAQLAAAEQALRNRFKRR